MFLLSLKHQAETGAKSLHHALISLRGGDEASARQQLEVSKKSFSTGDFWLAPIRLLPEYCTRIFGCSHLIAFQAVFSLGASGTEAAIVTLNAIEKIQVLNPYGLR